eukprot:Lankesteria_metandrocarpae@DN2227_c0_g1_i1.p1
MQMKRVLPNILCCVIVVGVDSKQEWGKNNIVFPPVKTHVQTVFDEDGTPVGFNFGGGGGMRLSDGTTVNFGGGGGVHYGKQQRPASPESSSHPYGNMEMDQNRIAKEMEEKYGNQYEHHKKAEHDEQAE